jgi:hypothetical protein
MPYAPPLAIASSTGMQRSAVSAIAAEVPAFSKAFAVSSSISKMGENELGAISSARGSSECLVITDDRLTSDLDGDFGKNAFEHAKSMQKRKVALIMTAMF